MHPYRASEQELERLLCTYRNPATADEVQIRQHLDQITSLLKECQYNQAADKIAVAFCHIIAILQDGHDSQLETLNCAWEQKAEATQPYTPPQEKSRCPFSNPEQLLDRFFHCFAEKKSVSTMHDYVARIRTFAYSPQYLGDMIESGDLGVQEMDIEPVLFTYENVEKILARFNTKDENGVTIRQRNNIRSALRMLNQFKTMQVNAGDDLPLPILTETSDVDLTTAPTVSHWVSPYNLVAPTAPPADYIDALPPTLGEWLNLALPEGVTTIPTGAFQGRSDLAQIYIPSTVSEIGPLAFSNCSSLIDIQVSANNPHFVADSFALYNADQTTLIRVISRCGDDNYQVRDGVTTIAPGAFEDIFSQEVLLPDSVTKIGAYAFRNCGCIREIRLSANVEEIGNRAFSKCSALQRIMVDKQNRHYFSTRGFLFNKARTTLIRVPAGSREECYLGKSVTAIARGAFEGCTKLKAVVCTRHSYDAVRAELNKAGLNTPVYIEDISGGIYTEDGTTLVRMHKDPREIYHVKKGTKCIPRSFAEGGTVRVIKIPASVTEIHPDAFSHCPHAFLIVDPGSYAETYAIQNGLRHYYPN